MLRVIDAGQIRPAVDRIFPLADAGQAQQYMDQQEQFGKIVLSIE
jgi:NADPH:quinone reductase-like Zn-dependent oxidoreductase